jgi:hypothetical protein
VGWVGIDGVAGRSQTRDEVYEDMNSYPPPPPPEPGVGHRLEEAIELIEMELRHAIGYVNDAVIPQVRSESISAMRKVSDTLRNLADRMDQQSKGPQG